MQTYLEMQTELTSRLGVASNSTKFPTSRIQSLIKDAHLWCTALYPFRELTVPKTTTTTGDENFDYPNEYRSFSIWALYVDGKPYHKKSFQSFFEYRRNNPSSTKRIFSDMARQYFIFPTPAAGKVLDIFGQVQATQLVNPTDKTIFSLSNDDGNEAIVLKALAVATNNQPLRVRGGMLIGMEAQALDILTKVFSDQKDNAQFDQQLDVPLFNVPDFFGGGFNGIHTSWQPTVDIDNED